MNQQAKRDYLILPDDIPEPLSHQEILDEIEKYYIFLEWEILRVKEQIRELVRIWDTTHNKQMIIANLGVFIDDFPNKFKYGIFKTKDTWLQSIISLKFQVLKNTFELLKKEA